ncbi:MAG: hypothetical protein IKO27_01810 [Ruminococcus sp.]|nr:hypothetical protein [Ruminococcus sp.]
MSKKRVLRILLCIGMALLTASFVWGVFITVLLISLNSGGEASYAAAVAVAVVLQMILYRVSLVKLTRRQRWFSCALGAVPAAFLLTRTVNGGGNFEMLGGSYNTTLIVTMGAFAGVSLLYEMIRHLFGLNKTDEPDSEEKDDEQQSAPDET